MILKRIEIFGFKSFGKKTVIDFSSPVTAIVGPNGSGKSNIVDAVRWVLGEQRVRSLRGNKMEDVIFSGSNLKRALGYAQVSLILDNSDGIFKIDYDEIDITRRLFRSGESEYLLNKTKCRLLDIQNLLMDTGLSREGYSIISQGQIESIVNNSPQERKLLIEEAVGIVKYRSRRQDAEKRLEKATANLHRINDIISEIESRLPNLKRQAQKAENFRTLANELRDIEVSIFVMRMDMLTASLSKAEEDKRGIEYTQNVIISEIEENENKKNTYSKQSEEISLELNASSEELKGYEEEYEISSKLFSEYVQKKNMQLQRIDFLTKELEGIRKNLSAAEVKQKEYEKEITLQRSSCEELKKVYEQSLCVSEGLREKRKEAEQKLLGLEEDLSKAQRSLSAIKENKISLTASKESLEQWSLAEKNQADEKKSLILSLKGEIKENEYAGELKKLKDQLDEKNKNIESVTQKGEILREDISEMLSELRTKDSRLKLLKGYDESLQGYKYAVRKIDELAKTDRYFSEGIRGILGEVISYRPEYAQAISRALGGAVEYIVTNDENVAGRAIEELKKHSWGRLTFLPKNIIKASNVYIDPSVKDMQGYIGLATELIECESEFRDAVDSVLYRTVVADNLKNANKIASKVNYKHKIVTLDGDVIMSGGAMVGGKTKNDDGGVLARKAEISRLEEEISDDKKKYDFLLSERSALSEEYKTLKDEYASLSEEYSSIKEKSDEFILSRKNIIRRVESLSEEVTLSEKNLASREEEIISLAEDIAVLSLKENEGEKHIASLSEKISSYRHDDDGEVFKAMEESSRAEVAYKGSLQKLELLLKSSDENGDSIKTMTAELAGKEENVSSAENMLPQLDEEINLLSDRLSFLSQKKEEIKKIYDSLKGEHDEITSLLSRTNEKILSLLADKAVVAEKVANAQNAVDRIELQTENLTKNMLEDYEITYADALEMNISRQNIIDLSASLQKVGELKEKIKRLGNINADAIEEYANERDRFEEMCNQRDDLTSSKEELLGIIDDMSKNMLSRFKKEFAVIQKEFNSVFKELFNGGEAKLILTDPDDILNSGVDIMACPPSTKLKNISALSGGEKTMTAISLIFAIIRIKPSPFIVLDEIDAALDDANVVRYCNFLRSIIGKNQFVIITHKKKTMESCDVLYGASMGNDGITKIVSVRLSDINEKGELKE